MKNKFVFPLEKSKYDLIIVIPTVDKDENNKRREKIIGLIKKYPPKDQSWNIYLAYEGKDWNEAINISFKNLKDKIVKGVILLDDDAFPTQNWMNNFEKYLEKMPDSILQWAMINRKGIIRWETKILKLNRISKAFISLIMNPPFLKEYWANSTKIFKNKKLTHPVQVHAVCFSTVFLPSKLIKDIGKLEDQDDNIVYGEDYDFCYRALEKGFRSYKIPRKVFHDIGTTKGKKDYGNEDKELYSDIWLYNKWFTNRSFIKKLEQEKLIIKKGVFIKLLRNETKLFIMKLVSHFRI